MENYRAIPVGLFFLFLFFCTQALLWSLPLRSTGSRRAGSAAMAHGPSRSTACGIFPDRGTNLCALHRQADSQPLRHQGSPKSSFFISDFCVHHMLPTTALPPVRLLSDCQTIPTVNYPLPVHYKITIPLIYISLP